ncbi:MAG: hypothetical protein K2O29_09640 [Ruminococcus sp.]|nr:hypothetical protein [Ruminococcus sp.]
MDKVIDFIANRDYSKILSHELKYPFDCMKILIDNFISKRNIDTYVKSADEKECHEVFDMLNEYKEENNF